VNLIIVGAGEVGTYLARILAEEGHQITVIDSSESACEEANKLEVFVVNGNGSSTSALEEAGIAKADFFISVTNLDEVNMLSCMTAKKLGNPITIAGMRDSTYSDENFKLTEEDRKKKKKDKKRKRKKPEAATEEELEEEKEEEKEGAAKDLGIDLALGTEDTVAQQIGNMIKSPGLSSHQFLHGRKLVLIENSVKDHFSGIDQKLSELKDKIPEPGNLIAIQRESKFIIPDGNTELREIDQVFTLTVNEKVDEYLEFFGFPKQEVHQILIVGCGTIGYHTARYLEQIGYSPTVIESDPERAQWAASRFKRANVMQYDATEIDIIREQVEQEGKDAVAVLLKQEETALLISMYAKHLKASQVICRVDDFKFAPIAYQAGVDSLISPQRALAQRILEEVRRVNLTSNMTDTIVLGDNEIEILDFKIPPEGNDKVCGTPMSELNEQKALPEGAMIGAILRGESSEPELPRGDTIINPGDHVILSVKTTDIKTVEKLFAPDSK
jgi:trk system potassium uptake protein TrkA